MAGIFLGTGVFYLIKEVLHPAFPGHGFQGAFFGAGVLHDHMGQRPQRVVQMYLAAFSRAVITVGVSYSAGISMVLFLIEQDGEG
ncbi:MAG: hypothetical protein KKH22_03955, partial [Proteobacteria bacterium]|nr:hypothetical protein [Pseudomonadota bacterium]